MISDIERKIGRFMIAAGAVIEHVPSGRVLVVKREETDFHQGIWEINYGRIDQHEELEAGLRREIQEETGITDITMKKILRVWHFYRGERLPENEVYGFTFHCQTTTDQVQLSPEHSAYQWVSVAEGIKLISEPGIRQDLEVFQTYRQQPGLVVADLQRKLQPYV